MIVTEVFLLYFKNIFIICLESTQAFTSALIVVCPCGSDPGPVVPSSDPVW